MAEKKLDKISFLNTGNSVMERGKIAHVALPDRRIENGRPTYRACQVSAKVTQEPVRNSVRSS